MIKNCPMRHENGNCLPAGGFCTANKNICEALRNAYKMGKAQLSQESTTKDATSDLISRQAAIDALDKQIKQCCKALGSLCLSDVDKHAVEVEMASLRAYRGMLENLPAIQPEPQEGYWIWVAGELMCSECRTIFTDLYPDYDNSVACPHCGAKMKGEPMNNREAVNWLINISADIGKAEHSDLWHYEQALTEIKDMLESIQPVATDTNVGDTISRQAAIELIKNYCENGCDIAEDNWCPSCQREQFIKLLKALPSAQPQSTTGQLNDGARSTAQSTDLIDRGQAIDEIKTVYEWHDTVAMERLIEHFNNLPTAQPEPQWIPISDRLPRDGSWNIFTDGKNISVERYKADAIDHFFPNGRWFQLEDVIAWMPLPEHYKSNK